MNKDLRVEAKQENNVLIIVAKLRKDSVPNWLFLLINKHS
jgi:hypothetical protein